MRYSIRTLLVLMAIMPPMLAVGWWYWRPALSVLLLAIIFCPELPFALLGYTFGGLCHLIGWLPVPRRRTDGN
jgi:hypothetical protein